MLVGFSKGGLPLYSLTGPGGSIPQAPMTVIKTCLRQILESSDSRNIFFYLCLNLVSRGTFFLVKTSLCMNWESLSVTEIVLLQLFKLLEGNANDSLHLVAQLTNLFPLMPTYLPRKTILFALQRLAALYVNSRKYILQFWSLCICFRCSLVLN